MIAISQRDADRWNRKAHATLKRGGLPRQPREDRRFRFVRSVFARRGFRDVSSRDVTGQSFPQRRQHQRSATVPPVIEASARTDPVASHSLHCSGIRSFSSPFDTTAR
jgi:hypothetical protein